METVFELKVENYVVVVTREKTTFVNNSKAIEVSGFTWAVKENGVVKVFDTFPYNDKVYTVEQIAEKGVYWIANLEKTPKLRFSKAEELISKYLS